MTDDEIKKLAGMLDEQDMRRLRRDLVLRFDARMEQITQYLRHHEADIERLAMGGLSTDTTDPDLVGKLADFALFFFVSDDNKTFVEDLVRVRADE